uniref:Active regulator of SIRT1 n=1 Tax=Suricata suricatta TaxID=37032 RepID=A0A673U516_SURSU
MLSHRGPGSNRSQPPQMECEQEKYSRDTPFHPRPRGPRSCGGWTNQPGLGRPRLRFPPQFPLSSRVATPNACVLKPVGTSARPLRNLGSRSGFRGEDPGGQGGSIVSVWAELRAAMSAALLRRGLELLGAPEAPQAAPGQAKPSGAPVKRTRKAKATQAQKLRNSAKGKVPKSALAEFQKRQCRGCLGVNLKFMTSARSPVAESVTQKIVCQNRGRKACDRPAAKTKKKKKAEGTVFTEEDFQKFQQEYFGS